jgi:hypothetical protein
VSTPTGINPLVDYAHRSSEWFFRWQTITSGRRHHPEVTTDHVDQLPPDQWPEYNARLKASATKKPDFAALNSTELSRCHGKSLPAPAAGTTDSPGFEFV